MPSRALFILRLAFLLVAAGLSILLIKRYDIAQPPYLAFVVFGGVMAAAITVIGLDMLAPRKQVGTISAVYFGVLVGLFLTYLLGLALQPLPLSKEGQEAVQLVGGVSLCYACTSLLLQTKNDFRFLIPYVEFSKEVKGLKPYILDTSVIIDGRIADVVDTKLIDRQIIMPRFVLSELQAIADSSDRTRRSRGRRGLDILNKLRSNDDVDLQIFDRELPEFIGQPVDMKLVLLARHLDGKVVTNDYNLNKVARLHGVGVVNLNDLANALKPVFLPGEAFDVRVMKPGEGAGQGVGYLDDGTMVVIEGGRDYLNQLVHITVTSVLQTSAGRMVFGRFESLVQA
ncbi:MAG: PIN/TRAM domain-containing protein [Pirellulales bacterium]